jgi:hypothetical protein
MCESNAPCYRKLGTDIFKVRKVRGHWIYWGKQLADCCPIQQITDVLEAHDD